MMQEAESDRRQSSRNDRPKELSVAWNHGGQEFVSRVRDLDLGGAFIQSAAPPPPPGTVLELLFQVSGKVARARAVVRRLVPGEGMGIEFVGMGEEDRASLALAAESIRELVSVRDGRESGPASSDATDPPHIPVAGRDPRDRALPAGERRAHPRHRVTAQVQVAERDSGRSISARLGNLSAGGCFLETETDSSLPLGTTVTVTLTRGAESFHSEAKVVYTRPRRGMGVTFTGTDPQQLRILGAWIVETSWLAADRRKSQRMVLGVPVRVMGRSAMGASFTEETKTSSINADGCSLRLSVPVTKGQSVTLLNTRTDAMLECVVVRIGQSAAGQAEIGLSFLLPDREFWQVSFPPVD
jgi:hypothetical protein